jgi:hypothetical protein
MRVLRLRQATAHPFLLEPVIRDTLSLSDIHKIQFELSKIENRAPVFEQIKALQPNGLFGVSNFGSSIAMNHHLGMAEAWKDATLCRVCFLDPTNAQKFDVRRSNSELIWFANEGIVRAYLLQ